MKAPTKLIKLISISVLSLSCQMSCFSQDIKDEVGDIVARQKIQNNSYRISTRLGLNTLNELNIQFEKPLKNRIGVYVNFGYNFAPNYFDSGNGPLCSNRGLKEYFARKGFFGSLGTAIRFNQYNIRGRAVFLSLEYRNLSAENIKLDQGCYGGSGKFFRYEFESDELAIVGTFDFATLGSARVNSYVSFGLGIKKVNYRYIEEGSFSNPVYTNRRENTYSRLIRLDVGFRL